MSKNWQIYSFWGNFDEICPLYKMKHHNQIMLTTNYTKKFNDLHYTYFIFHNFDKSMTKHHQMYTFLAELTKSPSFVIKRPDQIKFTTNL